MKNLYPPFFLLLLLNYSGLAQTAGWQWAKTAVESNVYNGILSGVATDKSGNVYACGYFFSDSISFGSFKLYNNDITGFSNDLFLVKYDGNGNVVWAKSGGGNYYDAALAVTTDNNGNVFIAGQFRSDSMRIGPFTLYNPGSINADLFVAKYDAGGNVLWAKSAGGSNNDVAQGIASDGAGNVYITGYFVSDSVDFGTNRIYNKVPNAASEDIFIAKYDGSGNALWARAAGGTSNDLAYSVAADENGNAFITGYFYSDTCKFGATALANAVSNGTTYDIFVARYDAGGNLKWALRSGGTQTDLGRSIALSSPNDIYVLGHYFSDSLGFGAATIHNIDTVFRNSSDIFLVKLDSNGNTVWLKNTGGIISDYTGAVTTDAAGDIFMTGYFYSPYVYAGADTVSNIDTGQNATDILLEKYSAAGSVLWAQSMGGFSYDYGFALGADNAGSVYVGGYYKSDTIMFGNIMLNCDSSTHTYPFLAKFGFVGTGTNDVGGEDIAINIYPNPTGATLVAVWDMLAPDVTRPQFAVYDISGRSIALPYSLQANKITFNTSLLARYVLYSV